MENFDNRTITLQAARKLMQQADKENSSSSFWLVSIAHKLGTTWPEMTMKTYLQIVLEEMPEQARQHADYLKGG